MTLIILFSVWVLLRAGIWGLSSRRILTAIVMPLHYTVLLEC